MVSAKSKRAKGARSDTSSSPDENKNPKGLFRKIFKKKSNNLSFHTPKEGDNEPGIIRRTRTVSEISRPTSIFGQIDQRPTARTPMISRRTDFEFTSTPKHGFFGQVNNAGTTGANQSSELPLPAAIARPGFDFGAFSRSDGSNSIDLSDTQKNEEISMRSQAKIQEQERQIAELKAQLKRNELRFAEEKRLLIAEHKAELKKKDSELVEKEINVLQRLSLGTPVSEHKFNLNDTLSNKTPLSEINSMNTSFNRSICPLRPQSLYINSTPGNRPVSSHDLVGKDRHRNALINCSNQGPLYVSRSSSTTPDSGAVIPLSSSPHLIPLFRELVTCVFHLHNSADEASMFTNDWLNNIRPQICSPNLRFAFAELLSKLDQMQNEDIEQIMEQTNKLLNDCINTLFGLRRDLVELRKNVEQKCQNSTTENDEAEKHLDLT